MTEKSKNKIKFTVGKRYRTSTKRICSGLSVWSLSKESRFQNTVKKTAQIGDLIRVSSVRRWHASVGLCEAPLESPCGYLIG